MSLSRHFPPSLYQHEHARPKSASIRPLLELVEQNNLKEMWDMILMLDYEVANVYELHIDAQEEFCGIIDLLLKAFRK